MKTFCLALISAALSVFTLHSAAQTELASSVPNRILAPIDESARVALKGNVHPLAQRQFDRGSVPASTSTGRLRLLLQRSQDQQRALTQYLSDVQNPASLNYHKWLTPAQYGSRFGISDADLQRVQAWLQSHGFKIEKVPQARNAIEFSGTVDQLQTAFQTSIHAFLVKGETHIANISDPRIPAALAPVIGGVGPLNDFRPRPNLVRGPTGHYDPSTRSITPDLTLSGNGQNYLFVDPADAAIIYNTPNSALNPSYAGTTYDGTGVSIGIAGAADLPLGDITNYRTAFLGEVSGSVNLPTVVIDGNDPGMNGAGTEAVLDNEVAGGIAPKAKIYFYTSADSDLSSGLFNAIYRALDDNTVSILSISFGECEADLGAAGNQAILEAAEQAAAQGISVTVSSGDSGSAGCDNFDTQSQATKGFGVNGFASTPYTIAVGGTDFDVLSTYFSTYASTATSGVAVAPYYATALKYIPENPWNDSTIVNTTYSSNAPRIDPNGQGNILAGSGGVSTIYSKPAFQTSLTPQDNFRDLPDVSFLAAVGYNYAAWVLCSDSQTDGSSQGYVACQNNGGQFNSNTVFQGVGGTSAAAPAFAGMLALVAQAHGSAADNYRLGQADSILYQLAQSKYSTVFHDITTGNISVACTAGSPNCGSNGFLTGYNATTKYDLASGLGSVDVAALVNNWTSVSLGSTTTSLKINGSTAAYTGVHGQPLKFDVSVTPSSASGLAALLDNANLASGGTLNNGQLAIAITAGAGSATYNGLPGGSYKVWARYAGDTANGSSSSTPPVDVTISPEASTTTLSLQAYDRTTRQPIPLTNIPLGSYIIADAQIAGAAEGDKTQGVATGTVSFVDGASTLGTAPVSSGNQASWPPLANLVGIPGGQHQVVAKYAGDVSYNPSASNAVSFNIVPAATTTQVQSTAYTVSSSQSAALIFNSYAPYVPSVPPGGSATVTLNGVVLGTVARLNYAETGSPGNYLWSIFGNLTIQASQLQPGLNTLTVNYSGDASYAPSSGTVTIDAVAPGGGVALTTPDTVAVNSQTSAYSISTITLASSGGYAGWINWSCSVTPTPNPFTCFIPQTYVPTNGPVDTILVLSGSATATAGTYTITIAGADYTTDAVRVVKTVQLTVGSSPSAAIAVINNGPITVAPGATTANTSNISIFPSGGFTGQVNLSCSVTTSISGAQSTPSCTVPQSVTVADTTPAVAQVQVGSTASTTAGSYTVNITATSASTSAVTAKGAVPLTVTASPSFSLAAPGIIRAVVGVTNPQAATVTFTPVSGFKGSLKVFCAMEPASGGTFGLLPYCTTPTSIDLSSGPATIDVTVIADAQAVKGHYMMSVIAFDPNSNELGFEATTNVLLGAAPSFALNNSGNIFVTRGATTGNTDTITLTPQNGFTGSVNLTCKVTATFSNPNDLPGCSLSPAQVNVTSSAAVTSTLTVTTTAATSAASRPSAKPFRFGAIPVFAVLFLCGLRSRRKAWARLLGALVLIAWLGTIGCGGGSGGTSGGGGNSGTTPGVYGVTVIATDAATGKITNQTVVNLTVN